MNTNSPLVVDLDGTLILTDMLHESALHLLKKNPIKFLKVSFNILRSKAILKKNIAFHTEFSARNLPYNLTFLEYLKSQKKLGRKIILCTASDKKIASTIADELGIFDEVLASDGQINLSGSAKADQLIAMFGSGNFDYAGNSTIDLKVWQHCNKAIVVNATAATLESAKQICEVSEVFPPNQGSLKTWLKMIRVHQWLKNVLLFVPVLAAHSIFQMNSWMDLLIAFFSFSLCASTVYIANDLLDLESDRNHPRKKYRPFASGDIPIHRGLILAPILLILSFLLGSLVNPAFMFWLGVYFFITCAYSMGLKKVILLDCITLAFLYTIRVVAGAAAVVMHLSFWLLAFSVFLFLSLAFIKRYAELELQLQSGTQKIHGRGYLVSDASLIQSLGVTAGFAAVIVLALYINSEAIQTLYAHPEVVWGVIPVLLFWISWMWMQAHRGLMHDDPLIFALKNKPSLITGLIFVSILILGALQW